MADTLVEGSQHGCQLRLMLVALVGGVWGVGSRWVLTGIDTAYGLGFVVNTTTQCYKEARTEDNVQPPIVSSDQGTPSTVPNV